MKVIVSQYGSRRRYLIPKILHKNGVLECLYTDSHSKSCLGKIAKIISRIGLKTRSLAKLIRRNVGIPKDRIKAYDGLQLKLLFISLFKKSPFATSATIFQGSGKKFVKWGVGDADWLYNMFIENIEFVRYAKQKGLKVLADIYENPYIFRELIDEIDAHPEFEPISYEKKSQEAQAVLREKYVDELLLLADQYLIPSQYVADCLRRSPNFDENKVNIIPYVSSIKNDTYDNNPIKGRIIWIGNDPVRKGLIYATHAVRNLKKKYPFLEMCVIGPMPIEVVESDSFNDVKFLGYLNKEQLTSEFKQADIYIFPTLAEGFAGSLLEAASFGVPIITTKASGFGDDFPGIFVEERSTKEIESAIITLMEDRALRDKMSYDFFEYSQKYNADDFEKSLMELLKTK